MGAPLITSGSFNEGVGHGGFYAQIFNNGAAIGAGQYYVLDPLDVETMSIIIKMKDPLGGVTGKAGVKEDMEGSVSVQVPVTLVGGVAEPVALLVDGYSFTDYAGRNWWLFGCGESYRSGEVWKQNCRITLKLH